MQCLPHVRDQRSISKRRDEENRKGEPLENARGSEKICDGEKKERGGMILITPGATMTEGRGVVKKRKRGRRTS
ncbi:unnamed protein product [Cochlearia groenlandica]